MWTFVTSTSREEGRMRRRQQSHFANLWIRPPFRRTMSERTMSESVIVFFIMFLHLILQATAQPSTQCREYMYYDHGTNNCEKCNEICDKALHLKTEDQCRELCPAYAKIIWPPKLETPQPQLPVTVNPDQLQLPGNAEDNNPLVLAISIPVSVLAVLILTVVIVLRIKKGKASSRRPAGDVETADAQRPEADRMLPLTSAQPLQTDVSLGPAAAGTRAVAGVQEQGELTISLNGLLSDLRPSQQSSMGNGYSLVLSPPISPPGAQGGDSIRTPVQASDQNGAAEMVLSCNRPSPPRYMSQDGLNWDRSLTDEEEYHSTEVKTSDYSTSPLLSSGEGGGGLSTHYP